MENNAAIRILEPGLTRFAHKAALLFRGREIPYDKLDRDAHAFAAMLAARGVRPRERVGLLLPDSPAFIVAFLGSMLHGAIPVPIGLAVPAEDRAFILEDSGAVLLACHAPEGTPCPIDRLPCDLYGPLDAAAAGGTFIPHAPARDDLAYILYTSGSTGRPKGVPHTHADLLVPSATLGPALLGDASNDLFLSASKLSFSYGLMAQTGLGLACGATLVLHAEPPDATGLPDLLFTTRPTIFFAVPAVYDMLLRTLDPAADLSFIRCCISSGEAMPKALHEAWLERTGLHVTEVMGSTETLTAFMRTRPGRDTPGTLGTPVPGFEVRIITGAGEEADDGERGVLHVRGPGIARSYWQRPEQSTAAMLADGWLNTGDLCVRSNGEISLIGRADDLFRSGGQWVIPSQVEECLLDHPAVSQCAVAPCRIRGMAYPCAYVVPSGDNPDTSLNGELLRFAKERLPRHMCPVKIVFMKTLPRTATGKIQRHGLKA
jgi:benzoate-CoA ligase